MMLVGMLGVVNAVDAQQFGLPDDRVEGDVVLADEVVNLGVGVVPPVFPGVRLTDVLRPLDAGGQVAHHRLEPDVEPLAVPAFAAARGCPSRCRA